MESAYRVGSMERNSNFFSIIRPPSEGSCDAFSGMSTSPHQMEGRTDTAEVDTWKDALISRNMDLVNCCLQAVLADLPSSERAYMGKLMTAVLKEVEDITVGKVELKAQSIFTAMESKTEDVEVEKPTTTEGSIGMPKTVPNSQQIPNRYRNIQPSWTNDNLVKLKNDKSIKSFVCPGCDRFVSLKSYCPACNNLVSRIQRDIDGGGPLPSCHHTNYAGAPRCRSCRFYKYTDLWKFKDKNKVVPGRVSQKTENDGLKCLGCQTTLDKTATRCSSCFFLVRKILKARSEGTPLPTCEHRFYSGCPDCESCRMRRFLNKQNMSSYRCGSCFQTCHSEKCRSCFNFGTSLEKAYGGKIIPECQTHKNRKGAPSCINCRYHLWKAGKKLSIGESSKKGNLRSQNEQDNKPIKEEDLDIKPDLKRIKIEV
ncbi:hypothetical protein GE061_019809 [Apolygus lucorum]|uniref:Uncharacterized protein n=1 Tax=Apolygus lucorum TaxID=248454 RepID=A0A6A4JG71_APOLU|nr:hypothetical protein GE061_019809 [Apolygus lucorum]